MPSPPGRPSPATLERARLLFEGNACPIWVFDAETLAFLDVNEAAIRLYGYGREEFLSMTIEDVRPKTDAPTPTEVARGLPGSFYEGTWRHTRKDGCVIDVRVTTNRVDWEGRPAHIVVIRDVTRPAAAGWAPLGSEERLQ